MIFQALETSAASLASATLLASTASNAQFLQKELHDPYGVIIAGTKITNTGNFFVEWIIKNPIFH